MKDNDTIIAKPFLKWAGGKSQLITQIEPKLPLDIYKRPFTYIEPFVGSGAILFWMLSKFPNIKNAVINDINEDLINCYKTIKNDVHSLIFQLSIWQEQYDQMMGDEDARKVLYYDQRDLFNTRTSSQVIQSALFIFLNRTCFNGLYRVNQKNKFNVPKGRYKKPLICNTKNLLAVSDILQNVTILHGDFEQTEKYVEADTLFYFDPPYKPLTETSSFTAYSKKGFDDNEQIRLKQFCEQLDKKGCKWILSNSDVKGKNPEDDFFDILFEKYNIYRVNARRSINANASKRGKLKELLITN